MVTQVHKDEWLLIVVIFSTRTKHSHHHDTVYKLSPKIFLSENAQRDQMWFWLMRKSTPQWNGGMSVVEDQMRSVCWAD